MTVALATRTDRNVGDGVEVGLEHLSVAEHFIAERVETIEGDSDICGRHPLLENLTNFNL
jgi:hypothetical protein